MTAYVSLNSSNGEVDFTFEEVSGFSFYSGLDNNTGKAVARWTKHHEEGPGSEDFVNLDPTMITVSSVDVDRNGLLCAFGYRIAYGQISAVRS